MKLGWLTLAVIALAHPAHARMFINPTGTLIANPEEHGLPAGTRIIVGTDEDDVFKFTGGSLNSGNGPALIVVGLGGADVMIASTTNQRVRYYGGYLRDLPNEHRKLVGDFRPRYWLDGADVIEMGPNRQAKGSFGADLISLHGANYPASERAMVWVQADDRVVMEGALTIEGFRVSETRPRAGGGYESHLVSVDLRGTSSNPATTGQRVRLYGVDPGHYFDEAGVNHFRPIIVRHTGSAGPSAAEQRAFVAGWAVLGG